MVDLTSRGTVRRFTSVHTRYRSVSAMHRDLEQTEYLPSSTLMTVTVESKWESDRKNWLVRSLSATATLYSHFTAVRQPGGSRGHTSSMETTSTLSARAPTLSPGPDVGQEELYSSWALFLICMLLILSLWTSYYLQIKRIRAVHETLVSIFAGMLVGLVVRLAPGTMIREMLVSVLDTPPRLDTNVPCRNSNIRYSSTFSCRPSS